MKPAVVAVVVLILLVTWALTGELWVALMGVGIGLAVAFVSRVIRRSA